MRLFLLAFTLLSAGCAHGYRFKETAPAAEAGDRNPSPVPQKSGDFDFVEYSVAASLRYPVDSHLDTRRVPRSRDVNSMDEVPGSSWFTPRLGNKEITPAELVKGPEKQGPPQTPFTIIKAKTSGNSPGFIIRDSRGLKYLIKFDRPELADLESTVNYVVNRVFWGFGYNVTEDYIVNFSEEDAKAGEGIEQEKVDEVYLYSHRGEGGRFRAVASLFLQGEILGPISPKGTRKGDANDTIAHENRRVLRGMRMFSAFLNNSGFRSDNSMDVYEGQPGQGHTVHYLLDFGENFGVHGAGKSRMWDGFEHFFSLRDSSRKFAGLGFPVQKWERAVYDSNDPNSTFEAEMFEPGKWKETTPFLPMTYSRPDDDYWAAKIISALEPAHLDALFESAAHPDSAYVQKVREVLEKRREKTIRYAFSRVSPLEVSSFGNGKLSLKDLGVRHGLGGAFYRVNFLKANGRKAAPEIKVEGGKEIEIPFSDALTAAGGYLRIEVTAMRSGKPAPRAAQFHVRGSGSEARLAGVLH